MGQGERTWSVPSGSVVEAFHGETPFTLNRKRAIAKTPVTLERLLSVDRPPKSASSVLSHAPYRDARIEVVKFAAAPGVWIPAWLFLPKTEAVKRIVVERSGRMAWHEGELYNRLAAEGCAADSGISVPSTHGP